MTDFTDPQTSPDASESPSTHCGDGSEKEESSPSAHEVTIADSLKAPLQTQSLLLTVLVAPPGNAMPTAGSARPSKRTTSSGKSSPPKKRTRTTPSARSQRSMSSSEALVAASRRRILRRRRLPQPTARGRAGGRRQQQRQRGREQQWQHRSSIQAIHDQGSRAVSVLGLPYGRIGGGHGFCGEQGRHEGVLGDQAEGGDGRPVLRPAGQDGGALLAARQGDVSGALELVWPGV